MCWGAAMCRQLREQPFRNSCSHGSSRGVLLRCRRYQGTATVLFGSLLTLSLVVLGACCWRQGHLAGFSVLWFYAGLILTSVMPLHILVSEQCLYLSLAGLAFGAVYLWRPCPCRRNLVIPAGLFGLLAVLTLQRNEVWRSIRGHSPPSRIWRCIGLCCRRLLHSIMP